jgi:hypothetical protein
MKEIVLSQQKIPYVPGVLQKVDLWRMKRRKSTFEAPTSPHFGSSETTDFFRKVLSGSTSLVEFGAGGSTYLAASLGIPFISVESDEGFLDLMKRRIVSDNIFNTETQVYLHRSIGETRRWGRPLILGKVSEERRTAMKIFSDFPNEFVKSSLEKPVVLIDGRFRIACALKAIRFLRGVSFNLLVDDYRSRRSYKAIAHFADLRFMVGRMAVFAPRSSVDVQELDRAIYTSELDWR